MRALLCMEIAAESGIMYTVVRPRVEREASGRIDRLEFLAEKQASWPAFPYSGEI